MEREYDVTIAQIEANYDEALNRNNEIMERRFDERHRIHREEVDALHDRIAHLEVSLEIRRNLYATGNVTGILHTIANADTGIDRQDVTVRETADGVSILIANAEIEGPSDSYPATEYALGRIVTRYAMYEVALVATADIGFTVKIAARDESSAHDEAVDTVRDALRNNDISLVPVPNEGWNGRAIKVDGPSVIEHSLETSYVEMIDGGVAEHAVGTYLVVHTT